MDQQAKIKISLPKQDLGALTVFRPDAESARVWARTLPVNRVLQAAAMLRETYGELNRASLGPETREKILEALRPNLDSALGALRRRYLNRPLVMPEEPEQMAALADDLLLRAGTAYTIVAIETIQQRDSIRSANPARLACEAIHRALIFHGQRVLLTFQLYRPMPMSGWQVLHQLYALAERQGLADLPLPEPLTGGRTIRTTYLQSLVLGCSKPNQLRQSDMDNLNSALRDLVENVELVTPDSGTGLFVVDLDSDQPPIYSSLHQDTAGAHYRYVNTAGLIERLYHMKAAGADKTPRKRDDEQRKTDLPTHLLDHLVASLGNMSLRNFKRVRSNAPLRVCLGFSCTHFHVAGRREFRTVLEGSEFFNELVDAPIGNPFLTDRAHGDMWSEANPEIDFVRNDWLPGQTGNYDEARQIELDEATRARLMQEDEDELPLNELYPVYEVQLTDASPGGYCLEWTESLPAGLITGDIVGIMEEHSQDWVIATIRWLSRLENARNLIGLELLSPRATAFGAVIHGKDGGRTPPMRVMVLPEIKLVGQPQTLLTPKASFKERQRVTLIEGKHAQTITLVRQVAATAGFAQFEFTQTRELGDLLSEGEHDPTGSPFDSLWSNI